MEEITSKRKYGLNIVDLVIASTVSIGIVILSFYTKSFWFDELCSIQFSAQDIKSVVESVSAFELHPPLYFLLLKCWISLCGTSEFILRIFQGLQGFMFIILSLFLFRKMLPNSRYHVFWLLLITSSEFFLFMPMLRYYTLAATFAILSTLLFFRWLEINNWKWSCLLGFSYLLIIYTDYPSSIIILYHLLYVLFKNRSIFCRLILIDSIVMIMFLPWMGSTVNQIRGLPNLFPTIAYLNESPVAIPLKFAYSIYVCILGEMIYPFEIVAIIVILGLIISVLAGAPIKKWWKQNVTIYSFGLVIIGVIFTSFIATLIARHLSFFAISSKTFFVLPFLMLFFGVIYTTIKRPFFKYVLLASFALANIYGINNWLMNRHFLMATYAVPWKEVIRDLNGKDGIILCDESIHYDYYSKQTEGVYPELINPISVNDLSITIQERLIKKRHLTVFLILIGRDTSICTIEGEIVDYIQKTGNLVSLRKYLMIDERYRKIRSMILGRESYDAKISLYEYEMKMP